MDPKTWLWIPKVKSPELITGSFSLTSIIKNKSSSHVSALFVRAQPCAMTCTLTSAACWRSLWFTAAPPSASSLLLFINVSSTTQPTSR